jgi:valyl-tRNA synthetase
MAWVLEASLIMAHPFAPFVTETIWQTLDWHPEDEDMLITTKWQLTEDYDEEQARRFEQLQQIVSETREIISATKTKDVALLTTDSKVIEENAQLVKQLARVGLVEQVEEGRGLRLTGTHEHAWLDLSDEEVARYKATLEKKRDATTGEIAALEHRLSNESYVKNAPEELVTETRESLVKKTSQLEHLKHQLKHL